MTSPNRAIILAAGQGKRLLPLTEDRPKCLIELSGRTLLAWQLLRLQAAGVQEAVIVTGFRADQVEAEVARLGLTMPVRLEFNPFYTVSDNTASCWIVREAFDREVLVLNGDTLFGPGIAEKLLGAAPADITVTIDRKPAYDADDMKVLTEQGRLIAIGKTITAYDAESIGFLRFSPAGAQKFRAGVEQVLSHPEGLRRWYLSVIDELARAGVDVKVCSIEGLEWGEMDFPQDVDNLTRLSAEWERP
ncbi:phosphocholine cytidylyltransferase family protein [Phenylobacterium sp.]|uniref:phosphocholine cytidylyltransferase family protein n=1 Tax=Phenylobacterium sp. TaxID=1871053 RepID=UPI0025D1B6A9|nr:phosphocholine cytidylyltransferase family protein [Phenylobacterium sp.]MBX3486132.1 phosphocholine cytidylyltransferase family protein [Phenylobacterium sp.]MCW5759511.1 phosphocholine cytidylyltransferase family protein [Phenylobacterium sp.]